MRLAISISVLLLLPAWARGAEPSPHRVAIGVTTSVVANCRIESRDLVFGLFDPLGEHADRPLDAAAPVRVVCTRNLIGSFSLGPSPLGGFNLADGSDQVTYSLYSDSSRTNAWEGARETFVGTGSGEPATFTLFGRIPAGQASPSGTYLGRLTARVDF